MPTMAQRIEEMASSRWITANATGNTDRQSLFSAHPMIKPHDALDESIAHV